MKIMLTSFGIEKILRTTLGGESVFLGSQSVFLMMPPVSFRRISESFMPDYELLVLCDQIVMDGASFEQLKDRPARAYSVVADTFRALKAEGRIELIDFAAILRANSDLLDKMLEHDLDNLDQWVLPLKESLTTWRHFAKTSKLIWSDERDQLNTLGAHTAAPSNRHQPRAEHLRKATVHEFCASLRHDVLPHEGLLSRIVETALGSAEKRRRKEYRGALRDVIKNYLAYVNANLVLASELEVPFHDWLDFTPFYATKFLSVGKREDETHAARKQVERLFTVAFPDLAIQDTRALLKILNDKRIQDLRKLIGDAVRGLVQFDERFAKSVLTEVLRSERRISRFRNVLGYITLPIGFIPLIGTPAQKIIEEAVGIPVAKKMKKKHRWFYMLSEIADTTGK